MSLLFLTDIINRAGLNPKEVKLIRHAFSHETFKKYYEMGKVKEYTQHQKKRFFQRIQVLDGIYFRWWKFSSF